MKADAITGAVAGLKEAGINIITSLPSQSIGDLIRVIAQDKDFIHIPVANENDAISICAGAWMGGKKAAFLGQNSGVVMATYALLDSMHFFGGFPMLLLADHRGNFGDSGGRWFFGYGLVLPKFFESMEIPYIIVKESNKIKEEIVNGWKTTESYGNPAAILLSGGQIW